ncbi:MAG: Peptidase inactive domain protein [Rhodospirillales bacterium]|nr:Peptidase inactive domain protein [Rhodospirillales bacterium]
MPTTQLARTAVLLVGLVVGSFAIALPARAVKIDRVISPGGIEAWLVQDHTLPIVTMNVAFRGGAASDPAGKTGRATMAASLLDEGAGSLDSQAYQGKLEDLASSVRFDASQDYVNAGLSTIKQNAGVTFDLLRLALTEPRFDDEAVARIRGDLVAAVARRNEQPRAIASRIWWADAFGDHPYARPTDGTVKTLAAISVADLKQFVHDRFARDTLKIAVVGDLTPEELKPLLDRTFGGLPAQGAPVAVPETTMQESNALLLVKKPIPQSVVSFGQPGIKRDDPDWYAATVVNHILGGGGFTSRLMTEVREKRGLAYGIGSYLVPLRESGVILGSVATQNEHVAESIDLVRQEWQRMHEDGPTEAELQDAKTYLTGSFPLQFDSTGHIAGLLVQMQQENLGIDYLDRRNALIEGVTLADAKRVARRLLDAKALTFAVVGTPANLTPTRVLDGKGS